MPQIEMTPEKRLGCVNEATDAIRPPPEKPEMRILLVSIAATSLSL